MERFLYLLLTLIRLNTDYSTTRTLDSPLKPTAAMNNYTTHHYHFKPHPRDGKGFMDHLNTEDKTLFVALIVMGIAVPCIFLSVFALLFIRKHKEKKARRAEMLLRNAQEIAVDDPRRPEMFVDHRY